MTLASELKVPSIESASIKDTARGKIPKKANYRNSKKASEKDRESKHATLQSDYLKSDPMFLYSNERVDTIDNLSNYYKNRLPKMNEQGELIIIPNAEN